jgi:hypothetical protein
VRRICPARVAGRGQHARRCDLLVLALIVLTLALVATAPLSRALAGPVRAGGAAPADSMAAASSASTISAPPSTSDGHARGHSRLLPPRLMFGRFVFLPTVHYASETKLGMGAQLVRPFRGPGALASTHDSDVWLKGLITLNGQMRAEFVNDVYFGDGTYSVRAKVSYTDLARRFWGVGPDSPSNAEEIYRPRDLLAYLELHRRILAQLGVGVRFEGESFSYLEREAGQQLESAGLPGTQGKGVVGTGLLLEWDTRNRRYSPTRGSYHQAFAMVFDDALGSAYDFNNYNLDLRKYLPLGGEHVLATQFFVYSSRGSPPIWRFAELGGRAHSRGYRLGRYVDRVLMAFQGEYRADLWWRLGMTAFAGLGDVAPTLRRLQLEHMRPTVGGGLRARVAGRDDLRARLDAAVGQGSVRFYLTLDEAF